MPVDFLVSWDAVGVDRDDGIETAHYNLKNTLILAYGDEEKGYETDQLFHRLSLLA